MPEAVHVLEPYRHTLAGSSHGHHTDLGDTQHEKLSTKAKYQEQLRQSAVSAKLHVIADWLYTSTVFCRQAGSCQKVITAKQKLNFTVICL